MQNRWSDQQAQQTIERYPDVNQDIALRVYTSRLIGQESTLVMHGGGNTSVKTIVPNQLNEEVEVIAVKGSGWDLSTIAPPGLPCVDLAHCRKLRRLDALTDEHMVNELRTHMLDHTAPNPSVETLLHAFLPHKFVDHSHADAILAIVDQENAAQICKDIFGDTLGIVEYIMPGFALSKKAAEVYEANTDVQGLLLLQHGLFTFGSTAKESYDRHIDAVTKAEEFIKTQTRRTLTLQVPAQLPQDPLQTLLPALRGLYTKVSQNHWIFHHRPSQAALDFANSLEALEWSQRGPITPDHVIRTKPKPLVLRDLSFDDTLQQQLSDALDGYDNAYHEYFETQNERCGNIKRELDRLPRVLLVQGVGLISAGTNMKAARVAADLYEHTIEVIQDAMAIGNYQPVSTPDIFDMEYWSLEQAKLGKKKPALLEGQVAFITGAASGIGRACAELFGKQGANLFLIDLDAEALQALCTQLQDQKITAHAAPTDVTDADAVTQAFQQAVKHYGGVDILISNAGSAFQGPIATCGHELFMKSVSLNFLSHQYAASQATQIMQRQNKGGVLLFNASKAAFNPGANFGPYAVPKAATLALMKQYALDYGPIGIRSNAINADRIRTGLFTDEFVKERAAARNLEPEAYFRANLLKQEVSSLDVAQAFLHLALSTKTTAATLTVDGGNIAASPR